MYQVEAKDLGFYDVVVCGGGVAGVAAAVTAARHGAKTLLTESGGCLGGTMTEGFMPHISDAAGKGGFVREFLNFLNEHELTCARHGKKTDENGKKIPGCLLDTEGAKYFFDCVCRDAGVEVLFFTRLAAVTKDGASVTDALLVSENGNYSVRGKIFVDASGSGSLSALAGCRWDCGDPVGHRVSPLSMGACAGGLPQAYDGTDSAQDKDAYNAMLEKYGIHVSAEQASVVKLPNLCTWDFGVNFEYGVFPEDIRALSAAVTDGRREVFETLQNHRRVPGYENLCMLFSSAHIGVREGRRIYGRYRLNDDDIIAGRRFEDAVCLVNAGVDVHKLQDDDTTECERGIRSRPYHIPYRSLVAADVENLLLAGRCISGDFYPFSSYRMMGNMMAVGEGAGYAAALCIRDGVQPGSVDGTCVCRFMKERGYEI